MKRWFSIPTGWSWGVCLILASLALGHAEAADKPAKTTVVRYVWKPGDSLSGVLYRYGLGRARGADSLYEPGGWIERNMTYSKRKAKDWATLAPGTRVELLLPANLAQTKHKVKLATKVSGTKKGAPAVGPRPGAATAANAVTPAFTPRTPSAAPTVAAAAVTPRAAPATAPSAAGSRAAAATAPSAAVARAAPATVAAGSRSAPATAPSTTVSRSAPATAPSTTISRSAPVAAVTGEDSSDPSPASAAPALAATEDVADDAAPIIAADAPEDADLSPTLEALATEEDDVSFATYLASVAALTVAGFLFASRRRARVREGEIKASLATSANAYLAALVMSREERPSAPELIEAIFSVADHRKAVLSYAELGLFAEDRAWIETHSGTLDRTLSVAPWRAEDDQPTSQELQRLVRDGGGALCRIVAAASSPRLCRAVLGRVTQTVEPVAMAPHRERIASALDELKQQLGPYPMRAPFVAAIDEAIVAITRLREAPPSSITKSRKQPTAVTVQQLLDHEALTQLRALGEAAFPELVAVYLEKWPEQLEGLVQAANENDPKKLAFAAHAFKASALQFGASTVAAVCLRIEQLAEAGQHENAASLFPTLEDAAHATARHLQEMITPAVA